jgi:hypothetical protein
MSTQIQRRRGTTAEHSTFTGVEGELTVDTTKDTAVVHDGTTVGGHPLQKQYPPLGSAAAPTYTFTGDTNTGIYSPGADQVAVSTGGTQRLLIDSSGNISLGSLGAAAGVTNLRGSSYHQFVVANDLYVDTTPLGGQIIFRRNAGASESMRIDGSGRLGIGTSSPGALTHLSNTSSSTGYNFFQITAGSESQVHTIKSTISTGRDLEVNSARTLKFTTGSNTGAFASEGHFQFSHGTNGDLVRITADGKVGIGTASPISRLNTLGTQGNWRIDPDSVSGEVQASISNVANTNFIDYRIRTNQTIFNTGGSERARIDSSGRLLVGTSTSVSDHLFQVVGGDTARARIHRNINDQFQSLIWLSKARGSGTQIVSNNDALGSVYFQGADGDKLVTAAIIEAQVDGTPGVNDMPGRLVFSTTADGASSPTERMRIDSSGRLGIGTTTVQAPLHIGTASAWMDIGASAGNRAKVGYDSNNLIFGSSSSAGQFIFKNNVASTDHPNSSGSELVRIDNSGRLLVGTSTDRNIGGHNAKLQVEDTGYGATLQSVRNVNGVDGAYLFLGKSRGTTLGSNTIVQSGDELGNVRFYGADGSTMRGAAEITCSVDGTPGDNDMPGRLVFSTTADGAGSPTERMRINSAGLVGIGRTPTVALDVFRDQPGNYVSIFTNSNSTSPVGVEVYYSAASPNNTSNEFFRCRDSSALRAEIRSNGGLANFSANNANLSDRNAKKDISPAAGTWDCIKEWEIVNYLEPGRDCSAGSGELP